MNRKDVKKIEKIAFESERYARLAIKKSGELHAVLSMIEFKGGSKKEQTSVGELFKKLKI